MSSQRLGILWSAHTEKSHYSKLPRNKSLPFGRSYTKSTTGVPNETISASYLHKLDTMMIIEKEYIVLIRRKTTMTFYSPFINIFAARRARLYKDLSVPPDAAEGNVE